MIYGERDELKEYLQVVPHSVLIEEFLTRCYLENVPPGKYELVGDEIFASVDEYETVPEHKKKWEAHDKYYDIQCIISGCEKIGYGSHIKMTAVTEYDPEKDIAFYEGEGKFQSLKEGDFMILAPGETHKPCISIDDKRPEKVKKVVVKVSKKLIETN